VGAVCGGEDGRLTPKRVVTHPGRHWKTKLPDVEFAVLPPQTTRPNPLVAGDKVFASIFSPGAVCGIARRSGELLWRTTLDSFAGSAVTLADGTLFAKSSRTLYALNPQSGQVRWEFAPHSEPGEWIYSEPAVGSRHVYIGDRGGDFHCLDVTAGRPIWRRRTSGDSNNQVNATALVVGPRVITANNAGAIVCYAARTGETIWRQRVEGPCHGGLLRLGSNVLVGANSLYGLNILKGTVRFEIGFIEKAVTSVTVAHKQIATIFGPGPRVADQDGSRGYDLVVIERGREILRRAGNGICDLGAYADSGLVVRLGVASMEVIDPSTGAILRSWHRRMALPDISRGFLYGLTDHGVVFREAERRLPHSRAVLNTR
jgi:outer membrane protein assembly factor BamB